MSSAGAAAAAAALIGAAEADEAGAALCATLQSTTLEYVELVCFDSFES